MRAGAMHGQDSGMVAKLAATASNDWYNATTARLAGLAGAPGNATQSYAAGLQGGQGAFDMTSRGLASIGYGIQGLSGQTPTGMTPAQQQQLVQLLLARSGGMGGGYG